MTRISWDLPDELLARVDAARGPVTRNRWLRDAVTGLLDETEPVARRKTAEQLADEAERGYDTSKMLVRRPSAKPRPALHVFVGMGKRCGLCGLTKDAPHAGSA